MDIEEIKSELRNISSSQPYLSYDSDRDIIVGKIMVDDHDFYQIKMDCKPFPKAFPLVWEIGRIPPKLDRHIFTENKNCCFTVKVKEQILLQSKISSLGDFILKIAVPFFENNSFFEITGKYANGEYDHNIVSALFQCYMELLGLPEKVTSSKTVGLFLAQISKRIKFRIGHVCYCGSGRKIGKCSDHFRRYKDIWKVDSRIISNDSHKISAALYQIEENNRIKKMLFQSTH